MPTRLRTVFRKPTRPGRVRTIRDKYGPKWISYSHGQLSHHNQIRGKSNAPCTTFPGCLEILLIGHFAGDVLLCKLERSIIYRILNHDLHRSKKGEVPSPPRFPQGRQESLVVEEPKAPRKSAGTRFCSRMVQGLTIADDHGYVRGFPKVDHRLQLNRGKQNTQAESTSINIGFSLEFHL
jgi:hypothetical protein